MPELTPQSTAAPAPPPMPPGIPPIPPEAPPVPEAPPDDDPPAAIPPIIDPDNFEKYPAFRETFLLLLSDPEANSIFRGLGILLHNLILEYWQYWPDQTEGLLRASLRAAIADMRHVQGFLAEWADGNTAFATAHEEHLAMMGDDVARDLGKLADRLEGELGSWRG